MDLSIKSIVLLMSILLTGLTAGLCFTWSNAVTPGIGRLGDGGFLQAFQQMNRAIINPPFLIVFMGPAILLFLNAYLAKTDQQLRFYTFLFAAILYFIGVAMVTIFKNVPLNEVLDKTDLATATEVEMALLREKFEYSWNRWHLVRSATSTAAFVALLIGTMFGK
ncbi:MAG: DUF1772 domain-containing protein [Bacteroidota bacterium]